MLDTGPSQATSTSPPPDTSINKLTMTQWCSQCSAPILTGLFTTAAGRSSCLCSKLSIRVSTLMLHNTIVYWWWLPPSTLPPLLNQFSYIHDMTNTKIFYRAPLLCPACWDGHVIMEGLRWGYKGLLHGATRYSCHGADGATQLSHQLRYRSVVNND